MASEILTDQEIEEIENKYDKFRFEDIHKITISHKELRKRINLLKEVIDLCAPKDHKESCHGNYGKDFRCDCGFKRISAKMKESGED
jgi:hypothetical protein